jgi:hypothetical protein
MCICGHKRKDHRIVRGQISKVMTGIVCIVDGCEGCSTFTIAQAKGGKA